VQTTCRHCQQTIEFAERRPARCTACGRPLDVPAGDVRLDYLPTHDTDKTLVGEPAGGQSAAAQERVGEYRLLRPLGQGGMGAVWEAEQSGTGRRVALKLLSPRLSPTAENIDRFLREGKLAASVSHPRSTFVFGAGQQNGQPYIAMELMPGRTLKDVLDEEGPLPIARAVDYILDVIDGLEAAHALGVIHRDVKPSNCFLDSDGRVKVGDFGLSKSLVSDADLTQTGTFLGTPQFAAPEQVKGGAVDRRTDVYAVGATLFCMLTGRPPFEGDPVAVIAQIASDAAPRLRSIRPEVRETLDRIVARTLQKDPARRYQDLAGLRRAVLPFATGGVSIADIGRRFAAYMLDHFVVRSVTSILVFLVYIISELIGHHDSPALNALVQFRPAVLVLYFALTESVWGRGLGKRVMGLRVVGPDGEAPGLGRSLLRSLVLPGAVGLTLLPPVVHLDLGYRSLYPNVISGPAGIAVVVALVFLCLITMRAKNGYRGLHEFASGTRVLRPRKSTAMRRRGIPVVLPVAFHASTVSFGPFSPVGELGRCGERTVIQARDDLLGRAVWIYRGPREAGIASRCPAERPTRPHWLQGGELADERWDAFEAIVGSRLSEIAGEPGGLAWHESRFWLLDLSEELVRSIATGTLPESLSLDQIWIARSGRLKLLESPLTAVGASPGQTTTAAIASSQVRSPVAVNAPAVERAVPLLRHATELCTRQQILPLRVRNFADGLTSRPATTETLDWAAVSLREVVTHPASLGWDDRLGILAISVGTELSFYSVLAVLSPALAWALSTDRSHLFIQPVLAMLIVPLGPLSPVIIGFLIRGGPSFWLTRIHVLQSDGRRASRWRCAWRNLMAWAPVMLFYGSVVTMLFGVWYGGETNWISFLGFLGAALSGLTFLLGAVYAIIQPQRGLQDLLAGTWLAPH
jgi:eukaryotic-like serine/threonine-protein kinase